MCSPVSPLPWFAATGSRRSNINQASNDEDARVLEREGLTASVCEASVREIRVRIAEAQPHPTPPSFSRLGLGAFKSRQTDNTNQFSIAHFILRAAIASLLSRPFALTRPFEYSSVETKSINDTSSQLHGQLKWQPSPRTTKISCCCGALSHVWSG
jgi:hypothetical protein